LDEELKHESINKDFFSERSLEVFRDLDPSNLGFDGSQFRNDKGKGGTLHNHNTGNSWTQAILNDMGREKLANRLSLTKTKTALSKSKHSRASSA